MEEKTIWNSQTNDDSVNMDLCLTPESISPESVFSNKQDEVEIYISTASVQDEAIPKNQEQVAEIRIESSGLDQSESHAIISDTSIKDTESKCQSNKEEIGLPSRSVEIALAEEISEESRQTIDTNLSHQESSNGSELVQSRTDPLLQVTEEKMNHQPENPDGAGSDPVILHPAEEGKTLEEVQVEDFYQDFIMPSSSAIETQLEQPTELEEGELTDESDDSEGRLFIDDSKEVD